MSRSIMNEIPLLLKCLMEETNMSHAELTRRSGVSRATITRILQGRTKGSIAGVDKLLVVFGCRLTVRRIPNLPSDFDSEAGHRHRPLDDPIEGNPALDKIRSETRKTRRP